MKMKMQQMFERLLAGQAEMVTRLEDKMDDYHKKIMAMWNTNPEAIKIEQDSGMMQSVEITRKIQIQVISESSMDFAANGLRKGPRCQNGTRCRDVMKPPHLTTGRKTATSTGGQNKREQPRMEGLGMCIEIFWKTFGLDFVRQVVRASSGFLQIRIWRVRRGRSPPKRKKK
jgi:hypothetical protein